MKSMAGCVGGLNKGNVCGAGRADGRGAGAWVVGVGAEGSDLECETRGELKLREAFTRRALAYDQVGLMSFIAQEKWHTYLFDAVTREPPPNRRYVSIGQALNADRELWQLIAQESRGDIKIIKGADPPLDAFIKRFQHSPQVNVCLAPLPAFSPHKGERPDGGKGPGKKGDRTGRGKGWASQGKEGKGLPLKRKGETLQQDPRRAEILKLLREIPPNCVSRLPKTRQFICALFQHGKCPHQSKERCERGLHCCWHKDCFKKGVPFCECSHS